MSLSVPLGTEGNYFCFLISPHISPGVWVHVVDSSPLLQFPLSCHSIDFYHPLIFYFVAQLAVPIHTVFADLTEVSRQKSYNPQAFHSFYFKILTKTNNLQPSRTLLLCGRECEELSHMQYSAHIIGIFHKDATESWLGLTQPQQLQGCLKSLHASLGS